MDTETVQTQYGDVSVDVGTCDECGQTMKEDNLYEYVIFDDGKKRTGQVCTYCADTNMTTIPRRDQFFEYFDTVAEDNVLAAFITLSIVFPAVLPAILLEDRIKSDAKWILTGATIGTIFWTHIILMIFS